MSQCPIDLAPLLLERPFYEADALRAFGIQGNLIESGSFADEKTASAMNAALRASIEKALTGKCTTDE